MADWLKKTGVLLLVLLFLAQVETIALKHDLHWGKSARVCIWIDAVWYGLFEC